MRISMSDLSSTLRCMRALTIRHDHTQVIQSLPVRECLLYSTLATGEHAVRVIVMLKIMADEELGIALRFEERAEHESMVDSPK